MKKHYTIKIYTRSTVHNPTYTMGCRYESDEEAATAMNFILNEWHEINRVLRTTNEQLKQRRTQCQQKKQSKQSKKKG